MSVALLHLVILSRGFGGEGPPQPVPSAASALPASAH